MLKNENKWWSKKINGATRENWTPGLVITNDALYHWATAAYYKALSEKIRYGYILGNKALLNHPIIHIDAQIRIIPVECHASFAYSSPVFTH